MRKGLVSSGFGFFVNLLSQIMTVPILLHYWGVDLYGEWLIISAIPAYISYSNLGLSDATATEMTIQVSKGNIHKALSVFQSTWIVVTVISVIASVLTIYFVQMSPSLGMAVGITIITHSELVLIIALFAMHIVLGMQFSILSGGYRCIGYYPTHILIVNLSKLLEFIIGMCLVVVGFGAIELIIGYIFMRLLFFFYMVKRLNYYNKWIRKIKIKVDILAIKKIAKPSISFAAFSAGNLMMNQGVVLSIGHFLGPSYVSSYSVMRAMTRFLLKLVGILNANFLPEMSAAYGSGKNKIFYFLNIKLCSISVWIVAMAVVFMAVFGKYILSIWTTGKIEVDEMVFAFIIVEVFTYSIWYVGSVSIVSTNKHSFIVFFYIFIGLFSLLISWILLPVYGLVSVPFVQSIGNIVVGLVTLYAMMKITNDTFGNYLLNILNINNAIRSKMRDV